MIGEPDSAGNMNLFAGEWETVQVVEVDAAMIGIGDSIAMILGPERLLVVGMELGPERPVQDFTQRGIQLITLNTGEDALYPVKVMRDDNGGLRAVRVEVTTDVDEVPGRWKRVGTIEVNCRSEIRT